MQPPAAPNRPHNQSETSAGTIVLIGASIRSAAQSANQAGFRVLGLDYFGDVDTRQACHEFWILNEFATNSEAIGRFRKFPHFIVGGLNSASDLVGLLLPPSNTAKTLPAQEIGKDLVPPLKIPVLDRLNDPQWLGELSKECGLSFPKSFHSLIPNATPLQNPATRWLVKMGQSCGGLGVRWHTPSSPLDTAHSGSTSAWSNTGPLSRNIEASLAISPQNEDRKAISQMFQQWVPGRPHGATLICNGENCHLLGVCRSLFTHLGDLPFVYRGSFGPVTIPDPLQKRLQQLGLKITRETGYRGLLNLDLILNRSGEAFVLEVNPRWSSSSELIERWLQNQKQVDSLFGVMVAACNGSPLPEFNYHPEFICHPDGSPNSVGSLLSAGPQYLKRIVFARQPFQFSQDLIAFAKKPSNDSRYQSTFSDTPADGTWISAGEPICTLISQIPRETAAKSFDWGKEKGPMHQHRTFLRRLLKSTHS